MFSVTKQIGAKAFLAALLMCASGATALQPSQAATLAATSGPTTVKLGKSPVGEVLVDDKGFALYVFTRDTPNTSVCYNQCAVVWPPLLTTGAPVAAKGVNQEMLGTITRKDGTTQVTYNGLPLYYWYLDGAAGQVKGQDVNKVWYVMNANGFLNKTLVAYVGVIKSPVGNALIDSNGKSLYMFTKDRKGTSVCYDQCAVNWPPLLTEAKPQADKGVRAGLLGTTIRSDGKLQVTYNGLPLYYWKNDKAAGDWTGQGVGQVWWALSPSGQPIAKALPLIAKLSAGKTPWGDIVVDRDGRSVYMFTKDANGESACYDRCAEIWPPVLTELAPVAGAGVKADLLGTKKRKDGKLQVTFNGMPLYYYAEDKAAGELKGQNVNSVWFVLKPSGEVLKPG
jgi:predicted lipoprotein with Yx(FWY)xxD motif